MNSKTTSSPSDSYRPENTPEGLASAHVEQYSTLEDTASELDEDNVEEVSDIIKNIPQDIMLRAKLICSHFLLDDGAKIIDVGCDDGALSAAIAHFCPRHNIIGVDRNKQKIGASKRKYASQENLTFIHGKASDLPFENNSIDAVVNSRILGDIYSVSGYREGAVHEALSEEFRVLKPQGCMVIYDYAKSDDNEFVLMEFPTLQNGPIGGVRRKTKGDRHAENLIWFSENARPKQAKGCEGFFLEELPPRFPYTKLFRLPANWAHEFIIRMESMDKISQHIGREHIVFRENDLHRELQSLGGRVMYSAPWQNAQIVENVYKESFRLYKDDGSPASYPHTGYVIAVEKIEEKKSLQLHELRSSKDNAQSLLVQTLRDEESGQLVDIVERYEKYIDVIPYTINEEGRIKVFLHYAAPKCLANTVPRQGGNIDGKRWSGHMMSALKIQEEKFKEAENGSAGQMPRLLMKATGLKISSQVTLEKGPEGYPAPDMISETIKSYFVRVSDGQKPKSMSKIFENRKGFSSAGEVREFDLEDVLRAVNAGFVPNAWLEIQLHDLLKRNERQPCAWMHEALPVGREVPPADQILNVKDILSQMEYEEPAKKEKDDREEKAKKDKRFRKVKGSAGKIRAVRSVFIDEGISDGRMVGLASTDSEFAMTEGETINKAVVLPLTSDMKGQTLAGFEFEEMPAPHRMGQEGKMVNLPSFTLPKDVTSIDEAKAFIAEKFDTSPDNVTQMGEGFFSYVDVTPQRIFPFSVASAGGGKGMKMLYAPIHELWMITDLDYKWSFLFTWGITYKLLGQDSSAFSPKYAPRAEAKEKRFSAKAPKHSSSAEAAGSAESFSQWMASSSKTNDNPSLKSKATGDDAPSSRSKRSEREQVPSCNKS